MIQLSQPSLNTKLTNQMKTTTTKKPTGQTLANLREIFAKGGAIPSSEWTSGSGNFISKRAIPYGAVEIERHLIDRMADRCSKRTINKAAKIFKARPRVQKVIVVTDWKSAKPVAL